MEKKNWRLLTIIGEDQPGIVASVTSALYKGGCNLGEASMLRLGGLFTVMMMVDGATSEEKLKELVAGSAKEFSLRVHVDAVGARLHDHKRPNVQITIYGADRAGIVSEVVGVLTENGLDILDLNSDVAGSDEKPVYILLIDGDAREGLEKLQEALVPFEKNGIEVTLSPLETMVG